VKVKANNLEMVKIRVVNSKQLSGLKTKVITIPNSNSSNEQTNAKDGFFHDKRLSFQSY
jgi:hypothetical protein